MFIIKLKQFRTNNIKTNISTMNPSNEIQFYVKLIYTSITKYYKISPDVSIKNFIEIIKSDAHTYFDIPMNQDVEIVEAGQFNNINGRDAELAPPLEHDANITLRDKYSNISYRVAFYIRPANYLAIRNECNTSNILSLRLP